MCPRARTTRNPDDTSTTSHARHDVPAHARTRVRLGLISDLHADADALERALTRLEDAGVERVVCLGDVVEKGPDADAVVETLRALAIPTVRGNHDENAIKHALLAYDDKSPEMSTRTVEWLAELPNTREYLWAGKFVTLAHGSPVGRALGVQPGSIPKSMRRWLRAARADVVLLGHTHVPMQMRVGATWLFNPGSVAHGRCGLGPTCATLELPSMRFFVLPIHGRKRVEVPLYVL